MGKDIYYTLKRGTKITDAEIAMIEAAKSLPVVDDDDNPEIDPVATPKQYEALMQAVAERNQRIERRQRSLA